MRVWRQGSEEEMVSITTVVNSGKSLLHSECTSPTAFVRDEYFRRS